MFSRFKKPDGAQARPATTAAVTQASPATARPGPAVAAAAAPKAGFARPAGVATPRLPAEVAAQDKEKKRKDRLQELKTELHKRLLDNLNLAALEHATEGSLKQEIDRFQLVRQQNSWGWTLPDCGNCTSTRRSQP